MALREEVPREFSDDVRWYRYFTQKMIATIIVVCFIGFLLTRILSLIHLEIIGLGLTAIGVIVALLLICAPMPKGNIMQGSGLLLGTVLFRLQALKKKQTVLFVKGLQKGDTDATAD